MLVLSMAGRGIRGLPLSLEPYQSSLHMQGPWCDESANVKTDRGCISLSGNVRVGRLAKGLSWNMGKLVLRLHVKSIQLLM
jgi:hypothetical protein